MPPRTTRRQPVRAVAAPAKSTGPDLNFRGRSTVFSSSNRYDSTVTARRAKRHLDDLERSNYSEPTSGGFALNPSANASGPLEDDRLITRELLAENQTKADETSKKKKKQTSNAVRMLLMYRKDLPTLMEESGLTELSESLPTYFTSRSRPSTTPPVKLCSICGYWGKYQCQRCGVRYCDLNCRVTHDETRCERRV